MFYVKVLACTICFYVGNANIRFYCCKWEVPYLGIGALAFVLYFCAALTPLCGYAYNDGTGLALGSGIYCVTAIIMAIPIFIGAYLISAKV